MLLRLCIYIANRLSSSLEQCLARSACLRNIELMNEGVCGLLFHYSITYTGRPHYGNKNDANLIGRNVVIVLNCLSLMVDKMKCILQMSTFQCL